MREVEALLEKAQRSFAAADLLLDSGDADYFAASRAYYGYFYVAQGLLLSEGQRYSRHGQVVAQYGRYFASTNRLDRRYHRFLGRAFDLRQLADYSAEVDVDPAVVSELIEVGEEFLEAAKDYLEGPAHYVSPVTKSLKGHQHRRAELPCVYIIQISSPRPKPDPQSTRSQPTMVPH